MSELKELTSMIRKFQEKRDWRQFHNPKDVAISLSLEAAEVLEHFQWKSEEEIREYIKTSKQDISEELADVLAYMLTLSDVLDIDLVDAFKKKMRKNELRYPVKKSKGRHAKYDKL